MAIISISQDAPSSPLITPEGNAGFIRFWITLTRTTDETISQIRTVQLAVTPVSGMSLDDFYLYPNESQIPTTVLFSAYFAITDYEVKVKSNLAFESDKIFTVSIISVDGGDTISPINNSITCIVTNDDTVIPYNPLTFYGHHKLWAIQITSNYLPEARWTPEIFEVQFKDRNNNILSTGGVPFASDILSDGAPLSALFDGNITDNPYLWFNVNTPTTDIPTIIGYYFPNPVLVEKVELYCSAYTEGRPKKFQIVWSDDGIHWNPQRTILYYLYNEVGDGSVVGHAVIDMQNQEFTTENRNWRDIDMSCGSEFAVAIKQNNTLYGIGKDCGQFGFGTHTGNFITEFAELPITNVKAAFCSGMDYVLFVIKDNSLWVSGGRSSAGDTSCKILGTGNTTPLDTFTQTGNMTNDWAKVVTFYQYYIAYALKTDGTLWSCGEASGSLNLNQQGGEVLTFTQVGSDAWLDIACGGQFFAGIKADGSLWFLQDAYYIASVPLGVLTQIGLGKTWVKLADSMYLDFFAINSLGELWGAGFNAGAGLGVSSNFGNNSSDPLTVFSKLVNETGWTSVSNWYGMTHAVRNGQLYGTGHRFDGLNTSESAVFKPVTSLNVKKVFNVHGDLNMAFFLTEQRSKEVVITDYITDYQLGSVAIVGATNDILIVPNEGTWAVRKENTFDSIIFNAQQGFFGNPSPIQYTAKNADGVQIAAATLTLNFTV